MQKLADQSPLNNAEAYNQIYSERQEKGVDSQDLRRWKKLLKHYRGGRLIDMGCLDSLVPQMAHEKSPKAEVWGIDLAKEAINDMQRRFPYIYFQTGDVYETKFPPNYFEYVVAGEVLEHLEKPEGFVREAMRILRPGGILALSTPLEEAREPGAVDHERHLWSFTKEDIETLFLPFGSVRTETLGSEYFPFYKYHWPSLLAWVKKK